jgi:penicillin-binding protein 2
MHNLPVVVAGKTGTSQVSSIPQVGRRLKESELAYLHRSHAWITTYAPYEDPQYVVTVLIEHGGHGGSTSAPMAGDIYRWLYKNGYFKEKPSTGVSSVSPMEKEEETPELKRKKEKIRKRNEALRRKSSQGLSLF